MQTFLPLSDFNESARVLDPSRLGNQFYREGLTLLRGKWPRHPASLMWRDHKWWLCEYLLACANELHKRGRYYEQHIMEVLNTQAASPQGDRPWWLGRPELHASHRANLLRKDPVWYGINGWREEPAEGYWWPSHHQYEVRGR